MQEKERISCEEKGKKEPSIVFVSEKEIKREVSERRGMKGYSQCA
jgi:hypothetical protein